MVFQDLVTSLSAISSEISDGWGRDCFDFPISDQSLGIMVRISATSEVVAHFVVPQYCQILSLVQAHRAHRRIFFRWRFSSNPNHFRFIADLFSLISFTIIQSDSNKNQFWIDILNQGFTNYRTFDSSRMILVESVDPWLEWTKWIWTNRNENFGGYLDEFHFRRIKL